MTYSNNGSTVLIVGSVAYDVIMDYGGLFSECFLKNELSSLNVGFYIDHKITEYGGCGGNIAYNLSLFGTKSILCARAGRDFDKYEEWMVENDVNTDYIIRHKSYETAVAYITTDKSANQITSFYPGAITVKEQFKLPNVKSLVLSIISPENEHYMMSAYESLKSSKFIFDPGQMITSLRSEFLVKALSHSYITIINEYEFDLLCQKLDKDLKSVRKLCQNLIVTKGAKGSVYYTSSKSVKIMPVKIKKAVDPTGCGDAYRAGLITGLLNGLNIELSCKLGSTAASFCCEEYGTQNHYFSLKEFNDRLSANFDFRCDYEDEMRML